MFIPQTPYKVIKGVRGGGRHAQAVSKHRPFSTFSMPIFPTSDARPANLSQCSGPYGHIYYLDERQKDAQE